MRGGLFSHLQGVTILGLPAGPPEFEFRPARENISTRPGQQADSPLAMSRLTAAPPGRLRAAIVRNALAGTPPHPAIVVPVARTRLGPGPTFRPVSGAAARARVPSRRSPGRPPAGHGSQLSAFLRHRRPRVAHPAGRR